MSATVTSIASLATKARKPAPEDQRLGDLLWGVQRPRWRRATEPYSERATPAPPKDASPPGVSPKIGNGKIRAAARGPTGARKWYSPNARALAVKAIDVEGSIDAITRKLRAEQVDIVVTTLSVALRDEAHALTNTYGIHLLCASPQL